MGKQASGRPAPRWLGALFGVRCGLAPRPVVEPLRSPAVRPREVGLPPLIGRLVDAGPIGGHRVWQVGLGHPVARDLVGIAIAVAVSQIIHQTRWGIADPQRNRQGSKLMNHRGRTAIRRVDRVRFRAHREVDDQLGEGEVPLRRPDEGVGRGRRVGMVQRRWIGESDVFRRESDEAAGDVPGIFPGLDHPREPVERCVWVASAEALVQRGDQIEVVLAAVMDGERPLTDLRDPGGVRSTHAVGCGPW